MGVGGEFADMPLILRGATLRADSPVRYAS